MQQTVALPCSTVVFDAAQIARAVDTLGIAVNSRCANNEWTMLCVMNGALVFAGELLRHLDFPVRVDSLRVSRYHDTTSGSRLHWHSKPGDSVAGKRILLVDDIFDEGETFAELTRYLHDQGVEEVVSVALVEKLHNRKVANFRPDFVGLECEDAYVFGFGMDYEGWFRNLPEIRQLIT